MDNVLVTMLDMSLPTRGAWIEIRKVESLYSGLKSLPTRGAWIEIKRARGRLHYRPVAPHTGSVD